MKLSDLGIGMDQYDRNARLKPALLVILPAALAVVALAPDAIVGWGGGIALIVQAGGSLLLAQIVGDIGKKKEPKLFAMFGGRPTERMLCHEHATNRILLADRHRKLTKLIPKVKVPTAEAEAKDPKAALEIYTACVDKLRGHARTAKEKHPYVHSENIHYGFRRNLWGVKPHGITVTVIALVILGAQVVGQLMAHQPIPLVQPVVAASDALLLVVWIFLVTPAWVMRAATLYAERLLEVLDTV
ncbi:MAG: hypothetical protein AB7I50_12660 [Vicinamibacterales bacterium]